VEVQRELGRLQDAPHGLPDAGFVKRLTGLGAKHPRRHFGTPTAQRLGCSFDLASRERPGEML
jgi:hypothetical protein